MRAMAYRRSLIARTKLFYQQHRQQFAPSFSHISSSDREEFPTKTISRNSENPSLFLRYNAANSLLLSGNVSRLMRSNIPAGHGLIFHRNLSKVPSDIEVIYDAAPVVGDKAVEAAMVVNEVAVAAADSFAPVAAFQYLVDYVHCYTGLQWWASIAAATLVIRFIQLPFLIHQLRFISKYFKTVLQPQLFAVQQALENKDDPDCGKAIAIMRKLVNKYGVIQLLGLFIADANALILFLAILNMAEKVPSFITGGTLWFTDLTTTGSIRLPVLFALTLWLRLELEPLHRVKGTGPRKNVNKFYAAVALLGTVTAEFPSAIYCYWITSNLFSIAYAIAMMDPLVQKLLGISMKPPPSTDKKTS